jgi:hypothetical protein
MVATATEWWKAPCGRAGWRGIGAGRRRQTYINRGSCHHVLLRMGAMVVAGAKKDAGLARAGPGLKGTPEGRRRVK